MIFVGQKSVLGVIRNEKKKGITDFVKLIDDKYKKKCVN